MVANPPSGQIREADLLARQKIFKLVFKWYLEDEAPKLLMPRFLVPKVVENRVISTGRAMCVEQQCKRMQQMLLDPELHVALLAGCRMDSGQMAVHVCVPVSTTGFT
ncbi:hypothetical protein ACHAWF_000971 [Thalassiosira exigua]